MTIFTISLALLGALSWWFILLAPWRAWSTRERLELPTTPEQNLSFNDVTILIPARNEAHVIEQTLNSLNSQGNNVRVLVIDDQSEDDTAQRAQRAGAKVISGTTPPPGWSGKLWALEQGLKQAKTRYTLLLDADITLSPGMLAMLLQKMQQENLSMLSVMAKLSVQHFFERQLIPAFIFFFKLLYPFGLANNIQSRIAAAAGGCILVETNALRSINAFASIHNALIDDCTLAAKIKQAGFPIWIGLSSAIHSHRGYDKLSTIWNMVARTAFTQLQYSIWLLLACTFIMVSMFWIAPLSAIIYPHHVLVICSLLTWLAMFIVYAPVLRFYQRSPVRALMLPVIGTLYLLMTWTSAIRYWRGTRAQWKNRRYAISKSD